MGFGDPRLRVRMVYTITKVSARVSNTCVATRRATSGLTHLNGASPRNVLATSK